MNLVTLTFQITPEQRRLLKVLAAQSEQSLRALMAGLIESHIRDHAQPQSLPGDNRAASSIPRNV